MNIQSTKTNVWAIVIATTISTIILFNINLDGVGMAWLVIQFIPTIIGFVTLTLYLTLRFFTQKNNWIITALGIILSFAFSISALIEQMN